MENILRRRLLLLRQSLLILKHGIEGLGILGLPILIIHHSVPGATDRLVTHTDGK